MKRLTILTVGPLVLLTALILFSFAGFLPANPPRVVALLNDQVPEQYNRLIERDLDGYTVQYYFNKNMMYGHEDTNGLNF